MNQAGHQRSDAVAEGLRPREERAISALMREPTLAKAAEVAAVGERTLRRWLGRPEFAAAYTAARRDAMRRSRGLLQGAAAEAVLALRRVIRDESVSPSATVAAARVLLEQAHRASEIDDLEGRLDAVEAHLGVG